MTKRYFNDQTTFSEMIKAGQPRREPVKVMPIPPDITLKDLIDEI